MSGESLEMFAFVSRLPPSIYMPEAPSECVGELGFMDGAPNKESALERVLLQSGAFGMEEAFAELPAPLALGHSVDAAPAATPHILRLSDALVEAPWTSAPVLGTSELPTVGSAGHQLGACKPCAFLYTKGCGNGVQCQFCHLCEPGEKKRRAKDKKATIAAAVRSGPWNLFR